MTGDKLRTLADLQEVILSVTEVGAAPAPVCSCCVVAICDGLQAAFPCGERQDIVPVLAN